MRTDHTRLCPALWDVQGARKALRQTEGTFHRDPPPRVRSIDSAQNTSVHMADCA